jgi:hypothetical protein
MVDAAFRSSSGVGREVSESARVDILDGLEIDDAFKNLCEAFGSHFDTFEIKGLEGTEQVDVAKSKFHNGVIITNNNKLVLTLYLLLKKKWLQYSLRYGSNRETN